MIARYPKVYRGDLVPPPRRGTEGLSRISGWLCGKYLKGWNKLPENGHPYFEEYRFCEIRGCRQEMISFLEMVQRYPIGAEVNVSEGDKAENRQEIMGYEYYNGTGYLIFRNNEKVNAEQVRGSDYLRTKSF